MGALPKVRGHAPGDYRPPACNQARFVVFDEIVLAGLNILAQMSSYEWHVPPLVRRASTSVHG